MIISACSKKDRFKGSRDGTINIQLADEQEVDDFRLLLKLSYGASYVEDDGKALSTEQLLRLAVLGDRYEFIGRFNSR